MPWVHPSGCRDAIVVRKGCDALVVVACKRSRCVPCSKVRGRRLAREAVEAFGEEAKVKLLTLTMPNIPWDDRAAALAGQKAVRKVLRSLKVKKAIVVAEITCGRSGDMHLHWHVVGVWDWVPQRAISALAVKHKLGPICDVRLIRGDKGRVLAYVSKYVCKAQGRPIAMKGVRRWSWLGWTPSKTPVKPCVCGAECGQLWRESLASIENYNPKVLDKLAEDGKLLWSAD